MEKLFFPFETYNEPELLGIHEKQISQKTFHKVCKDETSHAKIQVNKIQVTQYLAQHPSQEKSYYLVTNQQIVLITPNQQNKKKQDNTTKQIEPIQTSENKRQQLFLKPGGEDEAVRLEIYIPGDLTFHWTLILSPEVDVEVRNENEALGEYLFRTALQNIENLQGKVGVGLEW